MEFLINQMLASVVSGVVGGVITGVAAFAAIRVELKYLRRDVDYAHARLDNVERRRRVKIGV